MNTLVPISRASKKTPWVWASIAALIPVLLVAGEYGLEESIYPSGLRDHPALALAHNGPDTLTAEINDPAIRKLLANAAGVKNAPKSEGVHLTVSADGWSNSVYSSPSSFSHYVLSYPTWETKDRFPERLQNEITSYLAIRLMGHTRDFAVASVSGKSQLASSPPSSKNIVLNVYREMPASWLRIWEENGKAVGYYLIDGRLAWTFRFIERNPWLEIIDAQEFDPTLAKVFANARKKATDNLTARGVTRRIGYALTYWVELKNVLLEDYKISWWRPTDLNRGIYE